MRWQAKRSPIILCSELNRVNRQIHRGFFIQQTLRKPRKLGHTFHTPLQRPIWSWECWQSCCQKKSLLAADSQHRLEEFHNIYEPPRIKYFQCPSEPKYISLSYSQIQLSKVHLIGSICRKKKKGHKSPSTLLILITSICRYPSVGGIYQLPTVTSYVNVTERGFISLPNRKWLHALWVHKW